ncbi:MAG TPA: Snf7 family protein [Candidatus Lokiarchaeia archaeon]|nr:Snf7 family protein [Candidatus Lokiarchaeia archaeon]
MKKLFPKKKAPSADTGKADLKQSINQIRMGIKKYEKDSQDFYLKAHGAVAQGNMNLAKNYLLRRKRALNNLERFQGFIIKLERQQDAIDSAETIKTMGQTMKTTTSLLKKQVDELNPESIMEMNEESEEAIAGLEESAEVMGENPDSSDLESDELNDELEELKAQVMLDSGNILPETPSGGLSIPMEDEPVEVEDEATKSEKLKKELEKLKKELD